jgi:hypothetical protein
MRSNRSFAILLLVASVLLLAGLACSSINFNFGEASPPATQAPRPATVPPTLPPIQAATQPPGQTNESMLTVINQSSNSICFMRISPVTSSEWGDDWLGSDILDAGAAYTFGPMAAGMYDLRAEFCGGDSTEEYGFNLMADATWTVTGGTAGPGPGPGPQTGGTIQFTVINQTSTAICYMYISPVTSQYWEADWLGADTIPAGSSYTFDVPAGQYDLKADFCGTGESVIEWGQDLTSDTTWTITPGTGGSPGGGGAGLDYTLPTNFGEATLSSGFTPDPYSVGIVSGGSVDVSSLGLGGGCWGYANSAPDFEISYTSGSFSTLRFYFVSSSGGDTTLIINNGPTGSWLCGDDSYGSLNPTVDFQNPSSGVYDIWVGSYSSGQTVPGTLYITELTSNHP